MPTYRGHYLPTISKLVQELQFPRDALRKSPDYPGNGEGPVVEVRLVVGRKDSPYSGGWQLNAGPVDYDTWHGHCGAASLDGSESLATLRSVARDLLAEVMGSIDTEAGS